jgi:hypothetical protein
MQRLYQYFFGIRVTPDTMAMPEDDAGAMRPDQKPSDTELGTPDLTEGETTTDECVTDDEIEHINLFQAKMHLLYAEGRITALETKAKEYYSRAIKAEAWAGAAASTQSLSDSNELCNLRPSAEARGGGEGPGA